MAHSIRLEPHDIHVGMQLPWRIYDASGLLLLQPGSIIQSEQQRAILLKRGVFRSQSAPDPVQGKQVSSPFYKISHFSKRLRDIFQLYLRSDNKAESLTLELAADLHQLRLKHPNALLGAVHLYHDLDYSLSHPIHCAILCDAMAQALQLLDEQRNHLLAAALTANISILSLQERLHEQASALSTVQRAAMQQHPQASAKLLRQAGVNTNAWLQAVEQHHLRYDGSGYPQSEQKVPDLLPQILALSDVYSAMVVGRAYRSAHTAKDILRIFFLDKGKQHDENLCLLLIKLMGVFPPGCTVKLKNGEVAVVTHRPVPGHRWPQVAAILGSHGNPYTYPCPRDSNESQHRITGMYELDRFVQINLHDLWQV